MGEKGEKLVGRGVGWR